MLYTCYSWGSGPTQRGLEGHKTPPLKPRVFCTRTYKFHRRVMVDNTVTRSGKMQTQWRIYIALVLKLRALLYS